MCREAVAVGSEGTAMSKRQKAEARGQAIFGSPRGTTILRTGRGVALR